MFLNQEKKPEIVEVYWKDAEGNTIIDELPEDEVVTLYARVINTKPGEMISFVITDESNSILITVENCKIDSNGIAMVKNFKLHNIIKS